jgi:hypothetical protein
VSGAVLHAGIALGVNIDHVATLRQARRGRYPDPVYAALIAEEAGADSITLHLREDRRHIQDRDVAAMREALQTRMNLEMAVTDEMLRIAQKVLPQDCCLVPESRQEITTEGGLNVAGQVARIGDAVKALGGAGDRTAHGRVRRFDRRGTRKRVRKAVQRRQIRRAPGDGRKCRSRPQLSQRRTHRRHSRNHRTQYRSCHRGARRR